MFRSPRLGDASVEQLQAVAARAGYRSYSRYSARAQFLFEGVPLAGRRVLDVGCGAGAFALWAAVHGAEHVVGLEPEAAGSTARTFSDFRQTVQQLGLESRVECRPQFLQDIRPADGEFDVVVMYNVVNHLDETATMRLHDDDASVDRFVAILDHLATLLRRGATVIVSDAGRRNAWNEIGLTSPVARHIEWEKHQEPETWISVFGQAGFRLSDVRWSFLYPFIRLSSNRLVQYLTASQFVLRLRLPGEGRHT